MPKILFIDESGDHSLTRIDPQYPVFVLCGVILEPEDHDAAANRLNDFKRDLFGTTDIVLHTADFTRKSAGFERMAEHGFRLAFFRELELLIAGATFKIVACVIRKKEHLKRYGFNALDPYILALSILVERFIFECGVDGGTIVAEARDATLNHALELAFLDLKIRGTNYLPAARVEKRIHNFTIRDKRENIAGLQLADVVATPIGRNSLGKATYAAYCSEGDFFTTVRRKFRRGYDGRIERTGLVVLPE